MNVYFISGGKAHLVVTWTNVKLPRIDREFWYPVIFDGHEARVANPFDGRMVEAASGVEALSVDSARQFAIKERRERQMNIARSLHEQGLPALAANALGRSGHTTEQINAMSDSQLLTIRNFGHRSLRAFRAYQERVKVTRVTSTTDGL